MKHVKYSNLVPVYEFVPVAVETGGPWCAEAKEFVADLARRLRDRGADPRSGMDPRIKGNVKPLDDDDVILTSQARPRVYTLVYSSILIFTYWHLAALYGLCLSFTSAKWATILFNFSIYVVGGWGITAGAHRLWAHRSYKAKLPLQILLMLFQTTACQKTILNWVRDHRIHHKYCDTDADPHNSTRGFFYSHIGWLMVKKHPDTIEKGKALDMSDLLKNPVLQFQKRYYVILVSLLAFILPTVIPIYYWQETLSNAHFVSILRLVIGAHVTFAINSVAHLFGNKPYDNSISPTQNLPLSLLAFGEGYHNYHHVFPFDYRVSELGNNYLNFSTKFIDFFTWIGWAYDLKSVSHNHISNRSKRTGDGTDLWGREKYGQYREHTDMQRNQDCTDILQEQMSTQHMDEQCIRSIKK